MALYEDLEKDGWASATYPRRNIDKLAKRFNLIRYFHQPHISVDRRFLCKNGLCVFFDDFHVDILENGYTLLSFGKRTSTDEIMFELKNLERQKLRELKLSRIIKKSKNVT